MAPERPVTSRLRVALILNGGVFGGAERWQFNLLDFTDRIEWIPVVLGEGATADQWRARAVEPAVIPASPVAGLAGMTAAIRRIDPDLVFSHGVKSSLLAAVASLLVGVRCVWVRHDDSFTGPLINLLDRLTEGQVVGGPQLLAGRRTPNPLVLQAPRRPARPRAEACAALALDDQRDELILGMATRLVPNKGIDDAIRALPDAPGWRLEVLGLIDPGHPDEQARLRRIAQDCGVADRLRIRLDAPDAGPLLAAFDAVAVLTKNLPDERVSTEGFGMAGLEAGCAGVPLITVAPVSERFGGVLDVAQASPQEVAAALRRLGDRALREELGADGLRRALAYPDQKQCADLLASCLARAARRPGAGAAGHVPMSVVTTVLNETAATGALLDLLTPQLGVGDELLVVDGGSTDDTAAEVSRRSEQDPRIRLLVEPGAGISEGRNLGIAAARHEWVACTDAGCDPSPDWLSAFRAAIEDLPEEELLTGTYAVTSRNASQRALAAVGYPRVAELLRPTLLVRGYGALLGRSFDPSMPTGRSVAFTKAAWRRAGGFPENLPTGEDVTFGRAIVEGGGKAALVAEACVAWDQRPTMAKNLTMYYRYGQGSGRSRNPRLLGRDLARAAAYLVAVPTVVLGGRRGAAAVTLGALAYLSLPLSRALRGPQPLRTAALVPPVAAARDLAKAWGALRGLGEKR